MKIEESFDSAEKERYHFKKNNIFFLKRCIYKDYDDVKNFLKKYYYDTSRSSNNPRNRIDNHKIAACICYSFVKNKVFSFDVVDGMPQRMFTISSSDNQRPVGTPAPSHTKKPNEYTIPSMTILRKGERYRTGV